MSGIERSLGFGGKGGGGAGYFTEGNYNDFRSLNLRVLLCVHISFVSFEVYCLLSFVFT